MTELGRACGSGLETTEGGGASAVGAAAGAALSRSDALSPVADATVAASLVGDGSKTTENRGGEYGWGGEARSRSNRAVPRLRRLPSCPATSTKWRRPRRPCLLPLNATHGRDAT